MATTSSWVGPDFALTLWRATGRQGPRGHTDQVSYELRAIIGEAAVLRTAFADLPGVPLAHGLALIPAVDANGDEPVGLFHGLTERLRRRLETASGFGPVAYTEAEFFGGRGTQSAIALRDGAVLVGPVHTQTDDGEEDGSATSGDLAINQVLRALGAASDGGRDEFDAIGLGRFRETSDWVLAARHDA